MIVLTCPWRRRGSEVAAFFPCLQRINQRPCRTWAPGYLCWDRRPECTPGRHSGAGFAPWCLWRWCLPPCPEASEWCEQQSSWAYLDKQRDTSEIKIECSYNRLHCFSWQTLENVIVQKYFHILRCLPSNSCKDKMPKHGAIIGGKSCLKHYFHFGEAIPGLIQFIFSRSRQSRCVHVYMHYVCVCVCVCVCVQV